MHGEFSLLLRGLLLFQSVVVVVRGGELGRTEFVRAQGTAVESSPLHEPYLGLGTDAQPQ
ncbi:hypothetical protein Scep_016827 [Stephania cephalantha]|uniref:Uncharacterized protein n=1 Tax=Stephania cephalantha TaxID=152367 RepID=A0AAP0NUJ1_9MAGN